MSLQDVYRRFLADPKSASLATDVSLIYIPTTTKFEEADNVLTHLSKQQKIVKKKSEEIISAIEGPDSLCLDCETTLEFLSGGGAYLPSLDDNFLADRVATFPTVCSPRSVEVVASNFVNSCMLFASIPRDKSNRLDFTGNRLRC